MKQRIVSILLTLALCLSLLPATALAVEDGAPTEETPVCNCETACAEGNMNTECPMCGAEGAAPENCGQYQAPEQDDVGEEPGDPADSEPTAAEQVQAMIDALPTAEELSAMSLEEQQAVYEQLQAANDAYEALTDEQKAEVTGTEIFDELFEYLNSLTMTTGTTSNVQTDDSVAVVNGVYYTDFMEALKAATTTNMQPDMRTYCTLLKDITISSSLQGCVSINLNDYTLECNTMNLGGDNGAAAIKGPGTLKGDIGVTYAYFYAPLTINGDISQSGAANLSVSGSGIFRVNGNIGDFILSSKIDSGVTIVCTGTCYETDIQDRVITNLQKLTLNVSSNEGGTLTATGEKLYTDSGDTFAAAGSEVTLTATPTEGYHFKEWQASNGVTITDNKFSMPESDTEITAVFEEHIYEEWKSNGNDTHTGICSCGDEKTEACTFVDGVCTGCSYVDVTISAGPESSTVKEGETATFTVTANGDNIYYQWQFSTDNGSTWMDITDATSNSYTTAETTMDMDGYQYHCVVSNTTGDSATSDAATLTVNKTTSTITPAYIGYFVEHYQKDPVSGEYELAEREYFVDEINKEVTATPKTYEGYTYDPDAEGTVTNGTLTNIESEADIVTLKLYYTLNTYEVILNTNGGTIEDGYDVTSYTYGVGATLPTGEQITRKGYDFVGWYANEELSGEVVRAISDTDIGDKTYYAGWEASTYEVTLVTNGGTINSGSVTEYTYGVGATLPRAEDMTYDGHVFKGWYESEDFTGEAVTAISATDTGDKTYYARWTKLYTVTVTAGTGGTVSANKTTAAEGETVTLTAFPDSGYHFDGWRVVSGTVTIQNNHFTMPAGNVEIQAIFDRNSSGGGTPTKTPSQQAEDKIKGAKDGDTVEITLPAGRTELDKEVFETLAGRDVTLEVSVPGGVTWTVNGQDIPRNAALTDIDMGVSMGTSTIPVSIINAVTGEVSTVQFTLAHDGPFGFTMTLTAPLGAENAGLWANLYYYDEDSRALEFQAASRIGADGTASFPFSHASGYAIVIDTVSHEPVELPFTDVPEDAWYADAAAYVYRHGLMNGVSSTVFAPDTTTSRAMIATILWRMAGSPVVNYAMDYTDVAQGQWCSEAIRWATSEGIVTGYGDGLFGTNDPITRQQFAAMLWRYAQAQGYDVSIGEDTNILSYTDAFDVAEYAIPAIQWAVGAGIVNGTSADTLTPQGRATRAQAAVMLMRFCQRYTDSAE